MKKVVISCVLIMLMFFTFCGNVEAQSNYQTDLTANIQEVKTSQEVIVTIGLKNIPVMQKGLNAYHTKIDYDTNVFEEIKISDFESLNNWTNLQYNKANHELVAINKHGVYTDGAITKLRLRVKSNAMVGETKIKIRQFISSQGIEDIYVEDDEISLTIIKSMDDNTMSNNQPLIDDQKNQIDSIQSGTVPKTGDEFNFLLILFLVEGSIIFIIYKKRKNIISKLIKRKNLFIIFAISALFVLQIGRIVYAASVTFFNKGDVNNDGSVDEIDIVLLEKHLIGLELLPEENWLAGDINADGKITVTDLSCLVWNIEDKEDLTCEIKAITPENYYPKQGEDVDLHFEAICNKDVKIKEVQINGTNYPVETSDNIDHVVKVPAGNSAGIKTLTFEKVIFTNGIGLNVSKEIKVDVLKTMPLITDYVVEEDIDNAKVFVKINIEDVDKALTTGSFVVEELNISKTLSIGENNIEMSIEEGKKYLARINLEYDLDSNELNDITGQQNTGNQTISKEIQLNVDYQLNISHLKAYKEDVESMVFSKQDNIILKFISTNSTIHIPEKVKVNGTFYEVEKELENSYLVNLKTITKFGKKILKLEEVILSNGKVLSVDNLQIEIEKNAPGITNFKAQEKENTLDFTFQVLDEDQALENAYLVLLDGKGKEIERQDITRDTTKVTMNTISTDKYTVKIIADYNLSEANQKLKQTIYTEEITANLKITVTDVNISQYYVIKNGEIELTYIFDSNRTVDIKGLQINYIEYPVVKVNDHTYKVTILAANEAGIQDIMLRKVITDDQTEETAVEKNVQIEVLKDKPYITNYSVIDDFSNNTITVEFELIDQDNAFINGYTILDDYDEIKQSIQKGKNTFIYTVTPNQIYSINHYISYDLDTNVLNEITGEQNKIENELLETRQIQLVGNYQVVINNLKTVTMSNKDSIYFTKNENLKLYFIAISNTIYQPEKVKINEKEYAVKKENDTCVVELEGFTNSGIKEIVINSVILDNGYEVEQEDCKVQVEILKEVPEVTSLTHEINDVENKMKVHLQIKDNDQTITALKGVVINGNSVLENDLLEKYLNSEELTFEIPIDNTHNEVYQVQIIAAYDLDSNGLETGKNEFINQILFEQTLETGYRFYELKDIQDIILYEKKGDSVAAVSELDVQNLVLDHYLIKVIMQEQTDYYAKIKDYEIKDDKLYFKLDTLNMIQYQDNIKSSNVIVEYGTVDENKIARHMTLETLIEKIKADPSGTYELTGNLDAGTLLPLESSLFPIDFTGTLNGNGYTIKNLKTPLFNTLNGATIQNLVIQAAQVNGKGGILATSAEATTLKNVHLTDSTLSGNISPAGGMIGRTIGTLKIENSSVTNSTITGGKRTGGFIGWANTSANVTISNSYIQGDVTGSSDAVGGIIGEVSGNITIENCYSATIIKSNGRATGGIIGYYASGIMRLNNNLSLADGTTGGNRVHGNGNSNSSNNNYELKESQLASNVSGDKIKVLEKANINKVFFETTLGWDPDIWNLETVMESDYPTLKNADPKDFNNQNILKPQNSNIYIPEYQRLRNLVNYDMRKEILYANLYKLMPFYDAAYLVSDGSKINVDSSLNQKLIDKIIPYDKDGNMVTVLTDKEYDIIDHLKIVFKDDTTEIYQLIDGTKNGIVMNYVIAELKIGYNFPAYIVDSTNPIIVELVEQMESYDYMMDLDPLTSEIDSRLYKDFYSETTKEQLTDFILKLIANTKNYYLCINDDVMNTKVKNDILVNLKQLLYAYNYYNKWYSIDVEGVNLKDIVYYGMLYDNIDAIIMTNEVLATNANRNTNAAHTFYSSKIANYTNKTNIGSFIDYFIKTVGGYEDVNDWFSQNYQGLVLEVQAKGYENSNIEYRAWKHLKQRENYLLPLLTLPDNAAYVIACPSQIMVGAQRVYISDPDDESQRASLYERMVSMGNLIIEFYGTAAGLVPHERFNMYSDIQIDTYNTLEGSQVTGETEEPFHKYFNDAGNWWGTALKGVGAYAYGDRIYWVVYKALGDTSFNTWSHETGHDQDSKIFLYGNGRRPGSGAEDYADGNTSQSVADGAYNFNLAYNNDNAADKANNLTTDRINSIDKIESYYKNMIDTLDFLDYIEALAFLDLSPEKQSKIGVQVFYPQKDDTEQEAGDSTTGYKVITADEFATMNLKTVEDLWDNRIIIYPGITKTTTIGTNRYGYKTTDARRWYQPHNDNGVPDSYSLKQLAWEMLGIGGYEGGYITYYSGISQNDLEAIRKVTGDATMTWKKYKMIRYEMMKENWSKLDAFINADKLLEEYKEALLIDSQNDDRNVSYTTNIRKITYHYIKRATDDFRSDVFAKGATKITHVTTAAELKQALEINSCGMIVLDNDIDVSSIEIENEAAAIFDNVTFTGSLNGNGHTITGLKQPLFKAIKFSYIYDLKIVGAQINLSNVDNVGALAQTIEKSRVENVHVTNSTIEGKSYVGGLTGRLISTNVKNCSINADVSAVSAYAGGLAAYGYSNGIIANCYTSGSLTANGNRTGGLIGYLDTYTVKNCFSNSYVSSSTTTLAGGMFGFTNNARVENNLSSSVGMKAYLFDSQTANNGYSKYKNNYENADSNLISTTTKSDLDFAGKIINIDSKEMNNKEFYTSTLGWSEEIWDFKNVLAGGLPKLKSSLDTNDITSMIDKIEISTIEDLQKLNADPDKIYVLTNDLDAREITSSSALITTNFYGKLDGNGHKITNLNTAIFETLYGQLTNLKIENVNIDKGRSDYANVVAKYAYGAYVSNIKINQVSLSGNNYIALLFGYDRNNSIIEKVQITDAVVNGARGSSGCYNSMLIGRKNGGRISNVLVQGEMTVQYTDNGPVAGEAVNVTIDNVISKVDVIRTGEVRSNQNAGFVGSSRGTTKFVNCLVLGNVADDCYKFSTKLETNVTLVNCYEARETTGLTNVVENSNKTTMAISLEQVKLADFYELTLQLSQDVWDFNDVETTGLPKLK